MPDPELVAVLDKNRPIVVAEVHRAVAAPRCALVVRSYREVAFGIEQSGKGVRFAVVETRGARESGADLGLTAGTPCHQDFPAKGT